MVNGWVDWTVGHWVAWMVRRLDGLSGDQEIRVQDIRELVD